MSEQNAAGVEYSEVFIGECDRPATVRIFGDFVLCALHYLKYELYDEINDASLAQELLKPWRSQARMHDLCALAAALDRIKEAMEERHQQAHDYLDQLERDPSETRERMGKAEQALRKKYPTVFARVLAELSGYLGDDMEQLAKDQVSEVEPPYGDEEREALHARLESHDAQPPSAAFMHALARNLDLDGRDQTKLAMALAFEN